MAEYYKTTLTAAYLWGANLIKSGIGSKTNYYLYNAHGDVIQLTNTTGIDCGGHFVTTEVHELVER